MTEIDEAIYALTAIRWGFSAADIKRHINVAIEALREKAEMENGCDYCGLIYKLDGDSYGTDSEIIDNKYCPMCGRRLEVNP